MALYLNVKSNFKDLSTLVYIYMKRYNKKKYDNKRKGTLKLSLPDHWVDITSLVT